MFRILKNSARNCVLIRSVSFHFLVTEKSMRLRPLLRKISRPIFPRVPKPGGSIMDAPEAKQPHLLSADTAPGPWPVACDRHAALEVPANQGMAAELR